MRPPREGLVITLLLASAGCMAAGTPIYARQRAFDAAEYAPYRSEGSAELSGQAMARTRGGDIVFAADDTVYLFPATRYADEWWERTLVEGRYLTDPDPRSLAFQRITLADEAGRFQFRSLPAGDYYVVCIVTWKDILVGSTAHYEQDPTIKPLQVVNLGKRVHLEPRGAVTIALDPVSAHRALIEPPVPAEH